METTISRKKNPVSPIKPDGKDASSNLTMETATVISPHWYSGITKAENPASENTDVQVVDKGNCIEFILPARTAQFTEFSIFDTNEKLVWKTQSFNKHVIEWQKQTNFGGQVPKGLYGFCMKQDRHQANGIIEVA